MASPQAPRPSDGGLVVHNHPGPQVRLLEFVLPVRDVGYERDRFGDAAVRDDFDALGLLPRQSALAALPADDLILDGEAVVADSRGIPDFGLLHADLAAGRQDRLLYYAFDLLYLDRFDLRPARLIDRKGLLGELLAGAFERILYAEHLEGDGPEIHERACAMGLEGIISKQQDAPYRSGRTESWIKVKCGKRDNFPIVAFVEKLGAKPRRIATLTPQKSASSWSVAPSRQSFRACSAYSSR